MEVKVKYELLVSEINMTSKQLKNQLKPNGFHPEMVHVSRYTAHRLKDIMEEGSTKTFKIKQER